MLPIVLPGRTPVASSTLRESAPLDLDDVNDARSLAVLSVPPQSRVLDVGSGSGAVARALAARGCRVWGIDLDSTSVSLAEPWCDGVLLGDIETADLDAFLGPQRADAILFLDVLEHLRDPGAAIRRVLPFLAPGGKVILAVRHAAHAAVRLRLLAGAFQTISEALLDRPQLHYFDRSALQELFRNAGVRVIDEARIVRGVEDTEISQDLAAFPREAIDTATSEPDADTYQFVLTVAPGTAGTTIERAPTLVRTLSDRLHRAEHDRRQLQARANALEAAREEQRRAVEEAAADRLELLRSKLEHHQSEEQLARTTDELMQCQLERRFLRDDVLLKDAYLANLREQVSQLQRSHADMRVLVERLDNLTIEHAAEAKRAADLGQSNRETRQQLERAEQELHRLHTAVAATLAQPRYVMADRCNAWVKKAGFLHAALKRIWFAGRRGR